MLVLRNPLLKISISKKKMSKTLFTLVLLFICFAAFQSKSKGKLSSKFKSLSQTQTGAISAATNVLSQYGVNQGWTTFNALPRGT